MNLQLLNLAGNQISEVSEIENLKPLKKLFRVNFEQRFDNELQTNLICRISNYKQIVIETLSQIHMLDQKSVKLSQQDTEDRSTAVKSATEEWKNIKGTSDALTML
jgi:hypothetical protein